MPSTSSSSRMARLIALTSLALAPAAAQSTGLLTLFLPDSEPLSLEASAVAVNTVGRDADRRPVTTLEVACPTAASPENDACRSAGIYPAQVYHTQGSVWGGTTTYSADDSTTTWVCTLGGSDPTLTGECTKTIVGGGTTRTETAEYGNCYVAAHQRPIVVTAGLEKIEPAHFFTFDASKLVSIRSSQLAAAGCPSSQTTIWAGAVASTTGGASSAGETTSALVGSSGTITTAPTHTHTDPALAATTTTSPSGAGKGGKDPMAALLLGLGLTMVLGMVL